MAPLFLNITVFFLFMLPILTMRLIAEEKRQKTLELLMTTPVRPIEIVLGKYAAAAGIMTLMLGLTALFPALLELVGGGQGQHSAIDWHVMGTAYLGMFLLGSAFVCVGLFASSLSDSQIISVIVGFAVLLMFYVIGLAARGQEGVWQAALQYLSVNTHLEGFVHGVVRLTDVSPTRWSRPSAGADASPSNPKPPKAQPLTRRDAPCQMPAPHPPRRPTRSAPAKPPCPTGPFWAGSWAPWAWFCG
jgi:hypothetical protein